MSEHIESIAQTSEAIVPTRTAPSALISAGRSRVTQNDLEKTRTHIHTHARTRRIVIADFRSSTSSKRFTKTRHVLGKVKSAIGLQRTTEAPRRIINYSLRPGFRQDVTDGRVAHDNCADVTTPSPAPPSKTADARRENEISPSSLDDGCSRFSRTRPIELKTADSKHTTVRRFSQLCKSLARWFQSLKPKQRSDQIRDAAKCK